MGVFFSFFFFLSFFNCWGELYNPTSVVCHFAVVVLPLLPTLSVSSGITLYSVNVVIMASCFRSLM